MSKTLQRWSRRRFLGAAGGAAGFLILNDARSARSYRANEKLRIAAVGIGGMGAWNLAHFAGENVEFLGRAMLIKPEAQPVMTGEDIVALCDVDERPTDRLVPGKRNPAAETFARAGFTVAPRGEPSAAQVGACPKASCAVSTQRHQGLERTPAGRSERAANHSPMRLACARPSSLRLRCVEQSPSLKFGGSKVPGASA